MVIMGKIDHTRIGHPKERHMLFPSQRYKLENERLSAELQLKDQHIKDLERRAADAERTRHDLIEQVRYMLEAGADAIGELAPQRGEQLSTLGHVLPYLLSGKRHWSDPSGLGPAEDAQARARQLAEAHGFALPPDPVDSVKAMLDLAMMLFNPARSFPVEGWRNCYPLKL
jgi:hypothetical protein